MNFSVILPINYIEKIVSECLEQYQSQGQQKQGRQEKMQQSEPKSEDKAQEMFKCSEDSISGNSQTSSCLREKIKLEQMRIRRLDRENIFKRKRRQMDTQEYPKDHYIINIYEPDSSSQNHPIATSENHLIQSNEFIHVSDQNKVQESNPSKEE